MEYRIDKEIEQLYSSCIKSVTGNSIRNRLDNYLDDIYDSYENTGPSENEIRLRIKNRDIKRYRMKVIRSGYMLEIEIYPTFNSSKSAVKKDLAERKRRDPSIDERHNYKQRVKKIIRLTNGNFDSKDIWITVGYKGGTEPTTLAEARKDITNYIRRLRRAARKHEYPELKYLYVIEQGEKSKKFHAHIIMNFPDRDLAEQLWTKGKYPQARRLKLDDFGLEGLARYISKKAEDKQDDTADENSRPKNYGYSQNLYKSWQHAKVYDSKMTKGRVTKIAREEVDPKVYFQGLYSDYIFNDMEVNYSEYVSGCYMYVRMRRDE